jgi:hypothetical protein
LEGFKPPVPAQNGTGAKKGAPSRRALFLVPAITDYNILLTTKVTKITKGARRRARANEKRIGGS